MAGIKKELLDSVLDDHEKLAIQMFYDNEIQREAVKKILLFGIYQNGTLQKGKAANPLNNFALGLASNAAELHLKNEDLGEQLRAAWEGIQFVERAWLGMSLYKKDEDAKPKKENPAR